MEICTCVVRRDLSWAPICRGRFPWVRRYHSQEKRGPRWRRPPPGPGRSSPHHSPAQWINEKISAKKSMAQTHVAVFLLFFHFLVLDLGRAARSVLFALGRRNRVALQQTPRHEHTHIGDELVHPPFLPFSRPPKGIKRARSLSLSLSEGIRAQWKAAAPLEFY